MGIFWGLFLLVVLLSLGQGFKNSQANFFSSLSTNGDMAIIAPGVTTVPYKGYPKWRAVQITMNDLTAVQNKFPEIIGIHYIKQPSSSGGKIKAESNYAVGDINSLYATSQHYFESYKIVLVKGRMINATDEGKQRHNCMIGVNLAKKLFPDTDPIGQLIRIKNASFTVVGLIKARSEQFSLFGNVVNDVIIPLSVMTSAYSSNNNPSALVIEFRKDVPQPEVFLNNLVSFFKERTYVHPDDDGAIFGINISTFVRIVSMLSNGLSWFIWIVGIGTLISGIVGVSNIMLVSIAERNREIGVRRALGAKRENILQQIMLESFVITFSAGILGTSLGIGLMLLTDLALPANSQLMVHPLLPIPLLLGIIVIIAIAGIVSGLLPANRALRIDTIKALQEE